MKNFWWVNQKQTYRHEVPGEYMWSPKRQKHGQRNHSYDLMTKIRPGDVVFSFADGHIKAVGIARTYCYEFPKPTEFGAAGDNWNSAGWRIDVGFKELTQSFRPRDYNEYVQPLLAEKHAPLKPDGNGNQAYLFKISESLAQFLATKAGAMASEIINHANEVNEQAAHYFVQREQQVWEDHIETQIEQSENNETTRLALVASRRGQGKYRRDLSKIEKSCRITRVDRFEHLIASHIKPWRDGDNDERLDPENGLMLTPSVDHLFDKGFISFDENGKVLVAEVAHHASLKKMGVPPSADYSVGTFTAQQNNYLDFHREFIFLG
ncbi:HNH endonuclease signature motif containing protein [uncultured Umboniibacter sp.]|uniref:HNH endonuclease n=1 Tax=uncultured Umboniibacter sp. TaxID=1798917 RepID=UPI0026086518|nr:HNH endonuclease signature motif containing protein [uncultured Umboniibacter sp.]